MTLEKKQPDKTMTEFYTDAATKLDITFDEKKLEKIKSIKNKMMDLKLSHQNAFVAFVDISGFKKYMELGIAEKVINEFHAIGRKAICEYNEKVDISYHVIYNMGYHNTVESIIDSLDSGKKDETMDAISYLSPSIPLKLNAIFISDSMVLYFEEDYRCLKDYLWAYDLDEIFRVLKKININMLNKNHLLKTSIAYGEFKYIVSQDNSNIKSNIMVGKGYTNAYYDNEHDLPKIQPGECRFVVNTLFKYTPAELQNLGYGDSNEESWQNFHIDKHLSDDGNHLYHLWMMKNNSKYDYLKEKLSIVYDSTYENIKQLYRYALRGDWDKI